ncbi:hypothetical protein FRC10_010880 [Ceratobasidium sp. 414]|nr:hypothetical protein FRC10_010880 [Ceratobasidium sp. 414]
MDKYDILMNFKRQEPTGEYSRNCLRRCADLLSTGSTPPVTPTPTTTTLPTTTTSGALTTATSGVPTTTTSDVVATSMASTPTSVSPTTRSTTSTPSGTNTDTATTTRSTAGASPSASPTPTLSPSPTPTPSPSSTSTSTRLTSRALPTSSSASTTTSASSTPLTSSTTSTSTSGTPTSTSVTSITSVSTSSSIPTSSTLATSTTSLVPTSSIPRTTQSVAPTTTFIRTTSGGMIFTATIVIGQPSASASAAAKKSFLQNTGAVVGVFVVVGVVATVLAIFVITTFIRRRRAKQFDRDVQEAAREAALAQAPVDDDDYGANTSYNTHASQPLSTERPNYGYPAAGASSWDPYGRAGAGVAGYEMHNRRTSTGTSTAPGMAGFASGDSFARAAGVDAPQGSNQPQGYGPAYAQQQQQGYNNQGYNNQGYNNQQQGYNNTSPPQPYALAQERGPTRAPPQAKMMMPEAQRQQNYNTVDAYRAGPSYGQAHPGERVEYGHAEAYGRPSEDAYGGYERYDHGQAGGSGSNGGHTNNSVPPAYAVGPVGNAGATGDRKRAGASGMGGGAPSVGRQPSNKSAATRYSQDDSEGSADERPERRVLKVLLSQARGA